MSKEWVRSWSHPFLIAYDKTFTFGNLYRKSDEKEKKEKKKKRKANATIFALNANAKMKNKSEIPYDRTIPKHG